MSPTFSTSLGPEKSPSIARLVTVLISVRTQTFWKDVTSLTSLVGPRVGTPGARPIVGPSGLSQDVVVSASGKVGQVIIEVMTSIVTVSRRPETPGGPYIRLVCALTEELPASTTS